MHLWSTHSLFRTLSAPIAVLLLIAFIASDVQIAYAQFAAPNDNHTNLLQSQP